MGNTLENTVKAEGNVMSERLNAHIIESAEQSKRQGGGEGRQRGAKRLMELQPAVGVVVSRQNCTLTSIQFTL